MAEVLATMVVGPLVSMVKEKASSYLLDQYKVMEGMEEQHKLLKRKLPAVLDVITDAEEQAAKNREGAKAWLEELRNVAYKANDVLDEFKYEALRRKAKAEGHYKEFGMDVIKLFPSHNRSVFRYRMANKLRMILQEIDVLIAEMNSFKFKFKPQPQMSFILRQMNPNTPDDFVSIANKSRAPEKEEIVKALVHQKDNVDLTVLPIVGIGGMGKTTLVQLVYNDSVIQKHFQLRLWICVSENFDADSLAERIVESAQANGCQADGATTLDRLQNAVSGKRYLLVLDDVWNRKANKWYELRSYLRHGGPGSSVLTTTRDGYIAEFMETIKTHEIKGLDLNILQEIIKIGAFGSQAKVPTEFETLVRDISNRCKGSPLAATALGSILRTKNTVQEWKAVLNRSKICDEENGILPILKLSYNCLPPHMRQCFAFCAMFPKDHEIDVEMLIRLWMANCFIPDRKGVCPEITGQQIFNELAQRSFFQAVKQVIPDNTVFRSSITCKIHDLMHDVAQDSMGKECAALDTQLSQSEDFPYTARHVFLSVDISENVLNASLEKGSLGFHSLICDKSRIADVQLLSKYCRFVRALKTQQYSFLEPKYLHHIRYLDLSGSYFKTLPEDITILYHLQTLNLSDCRFLKQLPKAMKYMIALRHLYTHGCSSLKSMPPNLGHLTSLQTLTCFVLGTGSSCSNMGELEKLDLGGHLELMRLENATGSDAKAANLWDKKRLAELTLIWSHDHDKETDKGVLEVLRPHDGLEAMRIYCCSSSSIPTWMLELQGMVELELEDCQNLEKLPALWQLPSLQFLYLRKLQNLYCLFSGGAPSKFHKLKRMDLIFMPKFEIWWDMTEVQGEEVLFPEVEYLRIRDCGRLTVFPKASVVKQVTFPQLEKLEIENCAGLTSFPEAPKLSALELKGCSEEACLQAASRYFHSLSSMSLKTSRNSNYDEEENSTEVVVHGHESPCLLEDLVLSGCDLFFCHPSAAALWKCFGQLSRLGISGCYALDCWPENLFQGLVSLRTLRIRKCNNLTGLREDEYSGEQSTPGWSGGHLPCLESLEIEACKSLVQVPNQLQSASLKTLCIEKCESLKSMVFGEQQQDTRRLQISGKGVVVQQEETSSSLIAAGSSSSSEEASLSTTVVLKPGSSTLASSSNYWPSSATPINQDLGFFSAIEAIEQHQPKSALLYRQGNTPNCFFPCLEFLKIYNCGGLTEVANLPPSIKTLKINHCSSLVSLSGEVASLEELTISRCYNLKSLPNGPHQVYSSLRVLSIECCDIIKQLAPNLRLQQRENHLDEKDPDRNIQEQVELDSEPEPMSDGVSTLVVLKQSSSTGSNHSVFPCLEHLVLYDCGGFTEVASLPVSLKILEISRCRRLVSLSGDVPSLEELNISYCKCLESLPNGPAYQAYSSLRLLRIKDCGGIKQLPPSLQQRLDHLEKKDLDTHLQVSTGWIAALMSKLECLRSRSLD